MNIKLKVMPKKLVILNKICLMTFEKTRTDVSLRVYAEQMLPFLMGSLLECFQFSSWGLPLMSTDAFQRQRHPHLKEEMSRRSGSVRLT